MRVIDLADGGNIKSINHRQNNIKRHQSSNRFVDKGTFSIIEDNGFLYNSNTIENNYEKIFTIINLKKVFY